MFVVAVVCGYILIAISSLLSRKKKELAVVKMEERNQMERAVSRLKIILEGARTQSSYQEPKP